MNAFLNALPLRAGLTTILTLGGGLAWAAPPALDADPVAFLRFIETSPSPQAQSARREVAAGPAALAHERGFARKEGIAVVPAQINRPLPPDDRNAAPLYLKLSRLVHDRSIPTFWTPPRRRLSGKCAPSSAHRMCRMGSPRPPSGRQRDGRPRRRPMTSRMRSPGGCRRSQMS